MMGGEDYILDFNWPPLEGGAEESTATESSGIKPVGSAWTKTTANHYDYSGNVVGQVASKKVRINVKANNDAHVALGENSEHGCAKYEIVIGGWGNKRCVIRNGN
jgi:N-methylhydantoinase B/oxoprolinase/acetone carboxylase alpha subunit